MPIRVRSLVRLPTPLRSLLSHALVSTIEINQMVSHGVSVMCQVMYECLNATPGNTVISAMPTNVLTAKGMISMEYDRIWQNWLNEQIWRAWQ